MKGGDRTVEQQVIIDLASIGRSLAVALSAGLGVFVLIVWRLGRA